jgi:hypothetical protein
MGCDYGLCVMLRTVGLEALLKAIQGCYRMVVRLLGLPLRRQRGVTGVWPLTSLELQLAEPDAAQPDSLRW